MAIYSIKAKLFIALNKKKALLGDDNDFQLVN